MLDSNQAPALEVNNIDSACEHEEIDCPNSPGDLLAIVLVIPSILPPWDMNVEKLSTLIQPCLLHDIKDLFSPDFHRKICPRSTKVGSKPLFTAIRISNGREYGFEKIKPTPGLTARNERPSVAY